MLFPIDVGCSRDLSRSFQLGLKSPNFCSISMRLDSVATWLPSSPCDWDLSAVTIIAFLRRIQILQPSCGNWQNLKQYNFNGMENPWKIVVSWDGKPWKMVVSWDLTIKHDDFNGMWIYHVGKTMPFIYHPWLGTVSLYHLSKWWWLGGWFMELCSPH